MVGKIKVVFTQHVIEYLDDLVRVLYKKEYFGFIETAEEYVSKIFDAIPENIKFSRQQQIPKALYYLGSNYIFLQSE
ncbi:hypothetical protein E0I61_06695 [Flavobacterium ranwuense]|uniref:Type II toxin-antitoxin system RelE/ParE family toxin n=1 Tax=Flavobacterium ranwuense TaxID=2541725 RepID=A0ABY2DS00_9FLAO|nr:hypothetical protein [Flavobacterium ranwuense]TDE29666.1 hypothetical protein E0I61_06695 [Flavobacterium ranwuense]